MSTYEGGLPKKGDDEHLTREEEVFIQRYLRRPESFPPEFKRAILQWVALDGEPIPASQIIGGGSNLPAFVTAEIGTGSFESTSSTSYVNLTTPGPTLEGLSDGSYLVAISFLGGNDTPPGYATMGVSVNDATPATSTEALSGNLAAGATVTSSKIAVVDCRNNNNNTISAKYKSITGGTSSFARRNILALKIGN